jgi:hypothetical protein
LASAGLRKKIGHVHLVARGIDLVHHIERLRIGSPRDTSDRVDDFAVTVGGCVGQRRPIATLEPQLVSWLADRDPSRAHSMSGLAPLNLACGNSGWISLRLLVSGGRRKGIPRNG